MAKGGGASGGAAAKGSDTRHRSEKAKREVDKFKSYTGSGTSQYYLDHQEQLEAWKKSQTPAELKAFSDYQGSAYHGINKALNTGKELTEYQNNIVKALDSSYNRTRLPSSVIVWRGLSNIKNPAQLLSGTLINKGYTSTTLTKNVARHSFANSDYGPKGSVVLRIKVPKGSRAAIPAVGTMAMTYENEVLLGRGSRIRINKTREITKGKYKGMWVASATLVGTGG